MITKNYNLFLFYNIISINGSGMDGTALLQSIFEHLEKNESLTQYKKQDSLKRIV